MPLPDRYILSTLAVFSWHLVSLWSSLGLSMASLPASSSLEWQWLPYQYPHRSSFHHQLGIHWLTVSQTYQEWHLPLCTCCVLHGNLVPTVLWTIYVFLCIVHKPQRFSWKDHLTSPSIASVTPIDSFFRVSHVFLYYCFILYVYIIILYFIL